jgi:hypothetical protein
MVLFDQLRGIVQKGDARVKARATVEHCRIVLRTDGHIYSFLSLSGPNQVSEAFFPFSPN